MNKNSEGNCLNLHILLYNNIKILLAVINLIKDLFYKKLKTILIILKT